MKKYRIISNLTYVIIFAMLVSCKGKEKVEEHEELAANIVEMRSDQIKLADIQLGNIQQRTLSGNIKVSGTVGVPPQSFATVCVPMGGYVKSTNLIPGAVVHKGQTLAVIENQEFVDIQQSYLQTKSKLEYAEAEYKRSSDLYKDDVFSQKSMQQATAEYKSLKAQVRGLEQKLMMLGISPSRLKEESLSRSIALVSPISGYVKTVNANIGKFVSATDVLFEIVNNEKLFLDLVLFEKDVEKVAKNQKIRFFINNETEQHSAVVYQISKSVNEDKTYKVIANVTDVCKNIIPGMYVNAFIEASSNSVSCLPSDAIVSFEQKDYIFVFEKNKKEDGKDFTEYKMIQIKKGVTDSGFTEIILPEKYSAVTLKVVVKGAYNLLSAMKNAGEMSC